MRKRVVITGMGVVSPNGVGNEAFAEAIIAGKSGVRRIASFDASDIPVQIAGEVRDFDELAWVEKRDRKHVSRVLPLALAAATEALKESGMDAASLPLEERQQVTVTISYSIANSTAPGHPLLVSPEEWAEAANDDIGIDEVRRALSTIRGSLSEAVLEERRER